MKKKISTLKYFRNHLTFIVLLISVNYSLANCHPAIPLTKLDSRYQLVLNTTPAGSEILDKITGLVWKRCVEGMSWNGTTCVGTHIEISWKSALQRAANAVHSTSPGALSWRIPNAQELNSLVEPACGEPSINSNWFKNDPADAVWTSTLRPIKPAAANIEDPDDYAFYVFFGAPFTSFDKIGEKFLVRLVR